MSAEIIPINATVTITTRTCFHCGDMGEVTVPLTGLLAYERGSYVQDAFPNMDKSLREQIISGTHPECWIAMMGPVEEDDE
jgi:hypothetical protein